jgi:ParB-like chromosome segregation protein Spo0J
VSTVSSSRLIYDVLIKDIVVGDRYRKDLGDLGSLAASIRGTPGGMLQPIVVNAQNKLILGQRRLEAARLLGWDAVPCIIANSFNDVLAALIAESDENTCRKDFTPSEAVAIGKAIENLEKPKAEERQKATRAKGKDKDGTPIIGGGKLPPPNGEKGKTRDKVAEAVGMSGRTYDKAKRVVEAAEKEPEKHAETLREMDRAGKVDAAYKKVKTPTLTDEEAREPLDLEVLLNALRTQIEADTKELLGIPDKSWKLFRRSDGNWKSILRCQEAVMGMDKVLIRIMTGEV